MAFSATLVAGVQAQLANYPTDKVLQLVGAVDVLGGAVVNSSGVITIGGRALTNSQYEQIYEMCVDTF